MTGPVMTGPVVTGPVVNGETMIALTGPAGGPILLPPTGALLDAVSGVAYTMAVLLAAVFCIAAAGKLTARAETITEFRTLGLPAPRLLGPTIPLVELTVAVALLVRPRIGAAMAGLLLLAFTAVLATVVRSGRTVSCGCLGSLDSQPVTAVTVARNLGFLAMAGLAGTTSVATVPDPAAIMTALAVVLLAALGIQLATLRRGIGRIWSVQLAGESVQNRRAQESIRTYDVKGMTV